MKKQTKPPHIQNRETIKEMKAKGRDWCLMQEIPNPSALKINLEQGDIIGNTSVAVYF